MSLCQRNCNQCSLYLNCQGCTFCEKVFCSKDCFRCFSLCPDRPASFGYLKKIGGGRVELKKNRKTELPVFIPVVPDHLPKQMVVRNIIGVHGGKMLTSNGEHVARVYQQKGLRQALNIDQDIKGVLQFYVKDRAIEGLWDNRKDLYKELLQFPWESVIAPNFSVYEDAPRMDHLYNMKRSSIIYNEMLDAGLPAIPDLSWYNRIDLDQWCREINKNKVKTIAFSFQTVSTQSKASNTWRHYLMGYHYLMQQIPEDVSVVIAGIVSPDRLQILRTAGNGKNRISVLNQTAYLQSRRGILSEKPTGNAGELNKNQIFERNMQFFETQYALIGLGGGENAEIEK